MTFESKPIQDILLGLYGSQAGTYTYQRLTARLDQFRQETKRKFPDKNQLFNQRDVILICYADQLQESDVSPLMSLMHFMERQLAGVINTVHILPFFPYSSDDGFAVIDYYSVRPELGSWDLLALYKAQGFKLMFDAVLNHVSRESVWFQEFLKGDPKRANYFHIVEPGVDLSEVIRPRAHPLLTPVETAAGIQHVWTTFSDDQVDLNYANPEVLLDVIDVLLYYIERGADIIRMDAVSYIWKEIGTTCINLSQAHALIQLFRAIFEAVAPGVLLITETNVPHEQNIAYFGNGENEAHLVYQFPLPPLIAHALLTGSSTKLNAWARALAFPGTQTAFLNFTASHDGVGLLPAKGILSEHDVDGLVQAAQANGGGISVRANSGAAHSPYELNTTYFDLLNPSNPTHGADLQVRKYLTSQAIMLALAGVPAIYLPSLLGSRNFIAGVRQTGRKRAINRQKLDLAQVEAELKDEESHAYRVFNAYRYLIQCRIEQRAFDPRASQEVLSLGEGVFALLRVAQEGDEMILALHNLTDRSLAVQLKPRELGLGEVQGMRDILTDAQVPVAGKAAHTLDLSPYQTLWLKVE